MTLTELVRYFLYLGAFGFGGPVALVGFMHSDLVEKRKSITEDTYKLSLALAQIMPGPLAAQTAIANGYFEAGIAGATGIVEIPAFAGIAEVASRRSRSMSVMHSSSPRRSTAFGRPSSRTRPEVLSEADAPVTSATSSAIW